MKYNVGVLNFQYSDHNYGAVLQGYALQHKLKSYGLNVEHINFKPKAPSGLLQKLKKRIKIFLTNDALVKDTAVFERFRMSFLHRSRQEFNSLDDLMKESFNYEHAIVGSDQVWRARKNGEYAEVYFLSFLARNVNKVAYAASFGTDCWEYEDDENQTSKFAQLARQFNAISVRENTGVDICEVNFNVDAIHVLDPTLLSSSQIFEDIASSSSVSASTKIVHYKLDKTPEFYDLLSKIESIKGLDSLDIYHKRVGKHKEFYEVNDWLKFIFDSKLVITDSFHCVCFSILFRKDFLIISNEERGNARLESLLELLQIEDRVIDVNQPLSEVKSIDYSRVYEILEIERSNSEQFLLKALGIE
jgi:hypothetical protein